MTQYVAALYTHGAFGSWMSDPGPMEDVAMVAELMPKRAQDTMRIFALVPVGKTGLAAHEHDAAGCLDCECNMAPWTPGYDGYCCG